jgi:hypothetical protein
MVVLPPPFQFSFSDSVWALLNQPLITFFTLIFLDHMTALSLSGVQPWLSLVTNVLTNITNIHRCCGKTDLILHQPLARDLVR